MKLNKFLLPLSATLYVAGAHASVIAFHAGGANVPQTTDLYWSMLSNTTSTAPMGAIGNFRLSGHGDIHYDPATADFVNGCGCTTGLNLAEGTLIDSTSNWGTNPGVIGTTGSGGGCDFSQKCIYGLSFVLAGNTHYGWVQFHEINANRQHLMSWAYESDANTAIAAGIEESALQPVPEPASVALLGIGLAGIALLRRKKAG